MTEAENMEVVVQAIISTPGLARGVLPTSYIPILEVPYSEQRTGALAVTLEGSCWPWSGAEPVFSCS